MRSITVCATLAIGAALGTSGCANDTLHGSSAMMMLSAPAEAAPAPQNEPATTNDLSHKSFAAKVLASRALETVTGLKTDPARLSEHD